ncbi:hypothetical protein KORDIASMS9_02058 [Kordia sp. SMS9]|nr:hypothetical protein [Kordia sp. SMS9]AXG69830.1 hypothetical protein KORDIASMS9_02058 [Kordia sp. SMS9]
MKLPNQTKAVERKTYNPNAVAVGANASFSFGNLLKGAIGGALSSI